MGPVNLTRRRFLQSSLALASLALLTGCGRVPLPSSPGKVRRIAFLSDAQDQTQEAQVIEGLRIQGYVEGENLHITRRYAQGKRERFPTLIAELEAEGVEVIVCGGLISCIEVKQAKSPIPTVVWVLVNDVVDVGLVQNIARPEGNMTGIAGVSGTLFHTRVLETLTEAAPDARRVGVLAYARVPDLDVTLKGLEEAARRQGLQLEIAKVDDTSGIESAFSAFSAAGARALLIVIGQLFLTSEVRPRIAELARVHRLPSASPDSAFPVAGGLIAYSPNRPDVSHRVAWYVDKLLKGARPVDLPMERPTKFDFIVNLKTAQTLGLTVPASVLQQATETIQ